jgi:hypothetical protein
MSKAAVLTAAWFGSSFQTLYLFDFPAIFGLLLLHGDQETPR